MKVSVIVCTRNRSHGLYDCFDSVREAMTHIPGLEAELVVVDNASTDDTSKVVQEWAKTCPFSVNLVYEPKPGLATARNCGLNAAKGALIAFTDDDCRMDKAYIADLIRHDDADMVPVLRGGRVDLGDPRDLRTTIKTDPEAYYYEYPIRPVGFLVGANMAMRREVVDRIGLFDDRLGAGTKFPAEDCDYIIRAAIAGIPVQYVPDMSVVHFHGRREKEDARKLYIGYSRGTGALYAKHLFSHKVMARYFWWDIKGWLKSLGEREVIFPVADISRGDLVLNNFRGAFEFFIVMAKGWLKAPFQHSGINPKTPSKT